MVDRWKRALVHDLRQRNLRVSQQPRERADVQFGCMVRVGGPTDLVANLIATTASLQQPAAMTTVRDLQVTRHTNPDDGNVFYRVNFVFRA